MKISDQAQAYYESLFSGCEPQWFKSDPEFVEILGNFAFDEVIHQDDLDDKTRIMAILATLLGCQGIDVFEWMLEGAYQSGITPVEMKEMVYQGTAYLGIGRTLPFLTVINTFCEKHDIMLPLEGQSTTDAKTRLEKGSQAQVAIFGDHMKDFYRSGPEESRHINRWLAENCFGDYYTRGGLDLAQREMITFCFLSAQGGCEPQLISHAAANMRLGNDKIFLIKIISQCLPYIGYPRSLNALRCVNEACQQ